MAEATTNTLLAEVFHTIAATALRRPTLEWMLVEAAKAAATAAVLAQQDGHQRPDFCAELEDVLGRARTVLGLGKRPSPAHVQQQLVRRGDKELAKDVRSLAAGRGYAAHPQKDLADRVGQCLSQPPVAKAAQGKSSGGGISAFSEQGTDDSEQPQTMDACIQQQATKGDCEMLLSNPQAEAAAADSEDKEHGRKEPIKKVPVAAHTSYSASASDSGKGSGIVNPGLGKNSGKKKKKALQFDNGAVGGGTLDFRTTDSVIQALVAGRSPDDVIAEFKVT